MRPLSFLELIIVMILSVLIIVFLTVGFPRKKYDPCAVINRNPVAAQEYKDSCRDLEKWYDKSI